MITSWWLAETVLKVKGGMYPSVSLPPLFIGTNDNLDVAKIDYMVRNMIHHWGAGWRTQHPLCSPATSSLSSGFYDIVGFSLLRLGPEVQLLT